MTAGFSLDFAARSRNWRNNGTWKQIHDRLVEWVRGIEDRNASTNTASIDSQTVTTAVMVHQSVGYVD